MKYVISFHLFWFSSLYYFIQTDKKNVDYKKNSLLKNKTQESKSDMFIYPFSKVKIYSSQYLVFFFLSCATTFVLGKYFNEEKTANRG